MTTTTGTTSNTPLSSAMGLGSRGSTPMGPGGKMGKDEFIKLLVAQLKNQDPLNPAEGQEMAAQLAQFSSVEQLMNMNATLAAQGSANAQLLGTLQANAAMGAIGKSVLAHGNQLRLDGSDAPGVTAYVGGTGGTATLRIYDASGREVGTQALGYLDGGEQRIDLDDKLAKLPKGTYRYAVDVTDLQGRVVEVQPYMTARIDAVQMSAAGPILVGGGMTIPFGDVIEIRQ
ncbi:MAG TPA: flagellar hook assembly protein FlgD [Gemmatimonadaceae bacterium]|nr:flagellar hook assembly protein FlgD [Gemmatimonadaceae bacterium]